MRPGNKGGSKTTETHTRVGVQSFQTSQGNCLATKKKVRVNAMERRGSERGVATRPRTVKGGGKKENLGERCGGGGGFGGGGLRRRGFRDLTQPARTKKKRHDLPYGKMLKTPQLLGNGRQPNIVLTEILLCLGTMRDRKTLGTFGKMAGGIARSRPEEKAQGGGFFGGGGKGPSQAARKRRRRRS